MAMKFMNHRTRRTVKQAELPIDFVIVGGNISGLASAIALQRVGHRVTVLEQDDGSDCPTAGCRIPPNMSKVLVNWGMGPALNEIALVTQEALFIDYHTGEVMGAHEWGEEIMEESRGDFLLAHNEDLRKLLKTTALSHGAQIRYNAEVVSLDAQDDKPAVRTASGEVFSADVVLGADGQQFSQVRKEILGGKGVTRPTGLVVFATTVPISKLRNDPDFVELLSRDPTVFTCLGRQHAALFHPTGGDEDIGLLVWAPDDGSFFHGKEDPWRIEVTTEHLLKAIGTCDPRLRKMASMATYFKCTRVLESLALDDWVHDSAPITVIGDAAHALIAGSLYSLSMGTEDAAFLAEIFSHLAHHDQIRSFLLAFRDVRGPRCSQMRLSEDWMFDLMTTALDDRREAYTAVIRNNVAQGKQALAGNDVKEVLDVFAYEAEDAANSWWNDWGVLGERAKRRNVKSGLESLMDHATTTSHIVSSASQVL